MASAKTRRNSGLSYRCFFSDELEGLLFLGTHGSEEESVNWEDRDLLKTAGTPGRRAARAAAGQ
jgi:hypothetical protein